MVIHIQHRKGTEQQASPHSLSAERNNGGLQVAMRVLLRFLCAVGKSDGSSHSTRFMISSSRANSKFWRLARVIAAKERLQRADEESTVA